MGRKLIFLVDDDLIFRTAATVLLQKHISGYEVVHFENGLEVYERLIAIAESEEDLPELLFLDINMPVMNGWELLEDLKTSPPQIVQQIQIHILTSSIAPEDMNLSKTYNFINGYITKPLTERDLQKVRKSLE